jgi:hypothetical protein
MEEVLAALPAFGIRPSSQVPFFVGGVMHLERLPLAWPT